MPRGEEELGASPESSATPVAGIPGILTCPPVSFLSRFLVFSAVTSPSLPDNTHPFACTCARSSSCPGFSLSSSCVCNQVPDDVYIDSLDLVRARVLVRLGLSTLSSSTEVPRRVDAGMVDFPDEERSCSPSTITSPRRFVVPAPIPPVAPAATPTPTPVRPTFFDPPPSPSSRPNPLVLLLQLLRMLSTPPLSC